jgi:hypothetical protein
MSKRKRFFEYLNGMPILSEKLHAQVQAALDDNLPAQHKLVQVARSIKEALHRGEDTGLQDSKPKKGSSRAVYFPKDPHPLNIDGHDTHLHTVMKIAFPSKLDRYQKSGKLLGEHQNLTESHDKCQQFSILTKHSDGSFKTNHDHGVFAPIVHAHEGGHYNVMGRISPVTEGKFRELTKTRECPDGITTQEFHGALNCHWDEAHGKAPHRYPEDHHLEHPLVNKFFNASVHADIHPGDFRKANLGIWKHPVHGTEHIVASDYGYSPKVAKHYREAFNRIYGWGSERGFR